jgi:chemotaxis protein methyltransferase CheR
MTPQGFAILAAMLRAESGLLIGPDKQYLLDSRLGPILQQNGLRDLDALASRLQANSPDLARQVVEAMTTNETFFFRDGKPFTHFRQQALPRLHAARAAGSRLRVWSAAASAGQEAYSLAMIVTESAALLNGRPVEIVGTDISREQVVRARDALYTQFEAQRGLPMQALVKYFRKEGMNWRLLDSIRSMAVFREWNLLADLRPLGQFDVVFCRNVLIYFDLPTKRRVMEAIARQMAPDGVLYLGAAETVLGVTDSFATVDLGVYEPRQPESTRRPALAAAQ